MADELYVMSGMELAWGFPLGHAGSLPPANDKGTTPREALERVVRRALERPPCGVAFSGGRDSSLILAVAAHVARRDGLPEPIPITRVFPTVSEAQETEYQEIVIRHLGLQDWHRVVLHDELDVVGPIAAQHLAAHGVLWPPTIAGDVPLTEAVPGGTVMDGEGGDEVLGVAAHRVANLTRLIRRPRPIRWRRVRSSLRALAPEAIRVRHERERWLGPTFVTWLRPVAKSAFISAMEALERERPLRFEASVRMVPRRRGQVLGGHNRATMALQRNVVLTSPLLDPDVIHAIARDGGVLGRIDRTDAMRSIASDLLPDSVLSRTGKAEFTRCYMGGPSREFAAGWSGEGVDPELVDVDELRRIWRNGQPIAPTSALLQAAWLATHPHAP